MDVLRFIATGLSNKEISELLGTSEGTVKSYVQGIFKKLGVRRRWQAVLVGQSQGLVRLPSILTQGKKLI